MSDNKKLQATPKPAVSEHEFVIDIEAEREQLNLRLIGFTEKAAALMKEHKIVITKAIAIQGRCE